MSNTQALTPDEAKAKIINILENGTIKISYHILNDRLKLRNLSRRDICFALANGQIVSNEWDVNRQNWKYQVTGFDMQGDELTNIIVFFDSDFSLLVITAF